MSIRLSGLSAAVLAALGATALAQGEPDPRPSVHVSSSGSEPLRAWPGALRWFDAAAVTGVEWRYGRSDPVAAVEAIAGGGRWPFTVDAAARRATLAMTDAMRETWAEHGRLEIESEGSPRVWLRTRPTRLRLGPDGAKFSVRQKSSAPVPGSGDWAKVVVRDIFGSWIWIGMRTAEGATLAPHRSITQGDEVVFLIGEEEYALEVEQLKDRLIGRDEVQLRVRKRFVPRAEQTTAVAAPMWFQAVEQIDRDLAGALQQLRSAETHLRAGELERARAEVEAAAGRQDAMRQGLGWLRWRPPRLPIGPDGVAFAVEEGHAVVVPGSHLQLEVVLSDIHRRRARLGIRTTAGETLAAPRPVGAGDAVSFRLDEAEYAIEVEYLRAPWFGRREAGLRLKQRGAGAVAPEPSAATRAIELLAQELGRADERRHRALKLLGIGETEEARAAVEGARRRLEAVQQGIRWTRALTGEQLLTHKVCVVEDLSLVKVRATGVRPEFEVDEEAVGELEPGARAQFEVIDLLTRLYVAGVGLLAQSIEAQVLEAPVVGSRYPFATTRGRQFPAEKRRDLDAGSTVEVHLWALEDELPGIVGMEAGQEYWLLITPPVALKSIPRQVGESGRTWVLFALRCTPE
jgi:hypothetical protein